MPSPFPPRPSSSDSPTLFAPAHKDTKRETSRAPSLPLDLKLQATRRLRITGIVYAVAFLLADFVSSLFSGDSGRYAYLEGWLPGVLSILTGLAIAAAASRPMGWNARVNLGLLFEVAGSFGIAAAQTLSYPRMGQVEPHMLAALSPGWNGIWMLFYTVVFPAPPGRALVAALGSAAALPIMMVVALGPERLFALLAPVPFFFVVVFPLLITVMMAYVGTRIVYQLGADVSRARELGSYRLEHRLGVGGMGEVWKASHQLLARPAAIKFIRPEAIIGSDPEEARALIRRFELEARATAALTSEHTVVLYDFGTTDDGAFYYVMELLDGVDLEGLVKRFGPLPPARLVHLLGQVCDSLAEAHHRGLVHRDVKPANLYVCRRGNRCDFVKVLDFGLVHHQASGAESLRLTRPEQITGTPETMAPEIARGAPFDGRADLYALGCVAYWLATGRTVFPGGSLFEIVSQHLNAAPEPPSRHAPDGFPPELERLILDCLEKDASRRPSDARVLARRLRAIPLSEAWDDEVASAWWSAHLPPPSEAASPAQPAPVEEMVESGAR